MTTIDEHHRAALVATAIDGDSRQIDVGDCAPAVAVHLRSSADGRIPCPLAPKLVGGRDGRV